MKYFLRRALLCTTIILNTPLLGINQYSLWFTQRKSKHTALRQHIDYPKDSFFTSTQEKDHYCYDFLCYHAKISKERLQKITESIAAEFKSAESIIPPLKCFDRAQEKVNSDYSGDWEKISDILRGTLCFNNIQDLRCGVKKFQKVCPIHKIKDSISKPSSAGYRDIKVLFQDPCNGHIGELQFHLCCMLSQKEKAHTLYEKAQEIERRAKQRGTPLTDREKKEIAQLEEHSRKIYNDSGECDIDEKNPCGNRNCRPRNDEL